MFYRNDASTRPPRGYDFGGERTRPGAFTTIQGSFLEIFRVFCPPRGDTKNQEKRHTSQTRGDTNNQQESPHLSYAPSNSKAAAGVDHIIVLDGDEGASDENIRDEEEGVGAGAGADDEVIELQRCVFAALFFRFGTEDIVAAGVGIADGSRAKNDVGI